MNYTTSILIMLVCLAFSAYFSGTETAFSSLSKTRLKVMAEKGNRRAVKAYALSEQYDKMLTTILIGNNLVNIALSSICTMMCIELFGPSGGAISTVASTIVVLIFGEITPKSLAKESPEPIALWSTPFLRVLMFILTPFSKLFGGLKLLVTRLVHINDDRKITPEELLVLVDEVQQGGGIDHEESQLLRSAITFPDRDAEDILTHRVDLEAVPLDASPQQIADTFAECRFSRLLVYDEDIDDIVGVLHQTEFYADGGINGRPLKEIMAEPLFVPKSMSIDALLKLLQKTKTHMAVVSDGYGGTLGVVTIEDILEELVGEIWDEHDEVIEDVTTDGEHSWLVPGTADLFRVLERFEINEDELDSTSITGWVMERLESVPEVGDTFTEGKYKVTVLETLERRVQLLRVEQIEQPESEDEDDD